MSTGPDRRCQRLLTVESRVCGGALERFGRRVGCDEAGDDGGGEDSEALAGEVDRLDRLLAPKLLDGERVTVETANITSERSVHWCQRLLTVDKRVCGGVLERGEDLVLLETGGKVLGGLRIESVLPETATEASKGAHQNAST